MYIFLSSAHSTLHYKSNITVGISFSERDEHSPNNTDAGTDKFSLYSAHLIACNLQL